jgi:hypothetical protein
MDRTAHPLTPEEVMAYLDGELSPERATAAAAHLEHCAECRATAADLRSVSRQLAAWQVETAPEALAENAVRAAAAARREPKLDRPARATERKDKVTLVPRGLLVWGGAFAAAAVLVALAALPTLRRSATYTAVNRVEIPAEGQKTAPQSPPAVRAPEVLDTISSPPPASRTQAPRPRAGIAVNSLPPPAPVPQTANEPAATAMMMKDRDAKMKSLDEYAARRAAGAQAMAAAGPSSTSPMIIHRASLALLTKEFDSARAAMENLVRAHQGYLGQLDIAAPPNAGRSLTATLRVPAAQLDSVLAELRKLGRVEQENQAADDVTGQYVDLTARLANARETEKRLVEILRERTGKVGDVLDVEREFSGVRQQIEQMDAQRKTMENQVQYASVDLRITEEYKQSLETPAPALGTRLHNAAVDGFLGAADLVIGLLLFLLNAGPTLLLLAAMLAWPMWFAVRWLRRRYRLPEAPASQTA